jgi:hypothetical protein
MLLLLLPQLCGVHCCRQEAEVQHKSIQLVASTTINTILAAAGAAAAVALPTCRQEAEVQHMSVNELQELLANPLLVRRCNGSSSSSSSSSSATNAESTPSYFETAAAQHNNSRLIMTHPASHLHLSISAY